MKLPDDFRFNIPENMGCISSIFNVIEYKEGQRIIMRYKRVSNYNEMEGIDAFIMQQFYEGSDYQKKIYCFVMLETIRWNREILDYCYDDYIFDFLEQISYYVELNNYVNDLKRSCLLNEREEAINRVKCFYFKHVEGLCPDIVEKIINLLLPVVVDKIITH